MRLARPGSGAADRRRHRRACCHDARHRRDRADIVRSRYAALAGPVDVRDIGRDEVAQSFHDRRACDRPISSNHAVLPCIGDARALPGLDRFAFGSNEYPDRSTTLILQVEEPDARSGIRIAPGPVSTVSPSCRPRSKPTDLFKRLAINQALFPRGIDVMLVHDDTIVAIPRTTRLSRREAEHVCRRQGRRTRHRERPSPAGA